MPIVDAQVHIWAANTPERPWPARHQAHKPEPITKDDLLREIKGAGVDRVVLVPPSWGERNDICLGRPRTDRFAVMGRLDSARLSRIDRTLARAARLLGLRFTLHRPFLQPLLTEGRPTGLWPGEKAGVPIMTWRSPDLHLLDRAADVIRDSLTIDISAPKGKDEEAFSELDKPLRWRGVPILR
jgi:hypothetical protein